MTEAKPLPPVDALREMLAYDPDTGVITWKVYRNGKARAGVEAGGLRKTGYRTLTLWGEEYMAHRIAYALYHGTDPYPLQIDHCDNKGPKDDNRICNLRLATPKQNCANRTYTNTARPNIDHSRFNKPVRITYPDGGAITCRSINIAAFILNKPAHHLRKYLHRDGRIHHNRRDTGMRVTYAPASH